MLTRRIRGLKSSASFRVLVDIHDICVGCNSIGSLMLSAGLKGNARI